MTQIGIELLKLEDLSHTSLRGIHIKRFSFSTGRHSPSPRSHQQIREAMEQTQVLHS